VQVVVMGEALVVPALELNKTLEVLMIASPAAHRSPTTDPCKGIIAEHRNIKKEKD